MKYPKRYLKGFREGFNNPSQYNQEKLLNKENPDDMIKGLIAGITKKMGYRIKGENPCIWNETDLKKEVAE